MSLLSVSLRDSDFYLAETSLYDTTAPSAFVATPLHGVPPPAQWRSNCGGTVTRLLGSCDVSKALKGFKSGVECVAISIMEFTGL
jgi:hypothetical protein